MKKICLVLSLLLATVPLSACGSSDPTSNSDNGTTLGEGSGKTIDSGATSPDPGSGKPTPTPKRQEGTADNPLTGTPKASGSPGGASASPSPAGKSVSADLLNAKGEKMGLAILTQEGDGLKIKVEAGGLTAGKHGIHLHQVGKCEAPDFKSAGDHLNPEKKQHGTDNPNGPHVGDLPNLEVGADGKVSVELKAMHTTLEKGAVNSLFDGDGTALVIHEGPDDMKSDPAGNSGGRILCGVVK